MSTKQQYPKLTPIKFPSKSGKLTVSKIESTKGKSTREVISEMKKIAKKDPFALEK